MNTFAAIFPARRAPVAQTEFRHVGQMIRGNYNEAISLDIVPGTTRHRFYIITPTDTEPTHVCRATLTLNDARGEVHQLVFHSGSEAVKAFALENLSAPAWGCDYNVNGSPESARAKIQSNYAGIASHPTIQPNMLMLTTSIEEAMGVAPIYIDGHFTRATLRARGLTDSLPDQWRGFLFLGVMSY